MMRVFGILRWKCAGAIKSKIGGLYWLELQNLTLPSSGDLGLLSTLPVPRTLSAHAVDASRL